MHKLLIIGQIWPEPNASAAGSRMLQLVALFHENNYEITFASAAAKNEFSADLQGIGIETQTILLNHKSFDEFLKQKKPDIVLFDRFMVEEQFGWRVAKNCPHALRILDTEDLHFLRKARQKAFEENRDFTKSDLFSDLAKREIASILRCDLSLIISEAEIELLVDQFKISENLLYYLPFLLDPLSKSDMEQLPPFEAREHFVSIGNFLHPPNFDMVLWLKKEIWPLVKKKLPQAEMHVYGAYSNKKIITRALSSSASDNASASDNVKTSKPRRPKSFEEKPSLPAAPEGKPSLPAALEGKPSLPEALEGNEGFFIKGRANDSQEVLTKARVVLAPLRFGAGLKGKFVEAMLCGTPCVTTTIGAEGIGGGFPWNGEIANSPAEIANAAVVLYQNKKRWEKSQGFGRAIINQRFQKSQFSEELICALQTLHKNLKKHREQNFLGALLQHHSMQSTKYMARWIEEKNKSAEK